MSVAAYRAASGEPGDELPVDYAGVVGDQIWPGSDAGGDGPFADWGPPEWDPSAPEGPSLPPAQAPSSPNLSAEPPPWIVCKEAVDGEEDGGWREAIYLAGFLHGFPPITIMCDVVIGSPIVLAGGRYLSGNQAQEEVLDAIYDAGSRVQRWLNRVGFAPSDVICNLFRAELNNAFGNRAQVYGGKGYRARRGVPCVY